VLLPNSVEVNGRVEELIELPKDKTGCIILETTPDPRTGVKAVHAIPLSVDGKLFLGRGHDNDIRVTDISVSRAHAIIQVKNGAAYLQDNHSKFGTLVQLSQPVQLDFGHELVIQNGRSLLHFDLV
jgi:hypothetical protein